MKDANGRTALDLARGVGVAGVRQSSREPFPETVALLESLMTAKGIPVQKRDVSQPAAPTASQAPTK